MPSPNKPKTLAITVQVPCELIAAHMASSIGAEKSQRVVEAACRELGVPAAGILEPDQAEILLDRLALEEGLVGLAAKVTKQMVRLKLAPKPLR